MSLIFHITHKNQWQQAQQQGFYRCDSLGSEGFIHCSRREQVVWVADSFYRAHTSLVLLCIDSAVVQAEVKHETIENGEQFPHIYGVLNLDAVVDILDFAPGKDGLFELPEIKV